MLQKKKRITQIILGIMMMAACVGVLRQFSPDGKLRRNAVSEAEYMRILESHNYSEEGLLHGLWFDADPVLFLRESDTFYYSVAREDADRFDPRVTADGTDVRIAVLSDPIDAALIRSNGTIKLLAYNDTSYHEYSLKLTELPMINVVTDREFSKIHPAACTIEVFDCNRDATLYYSISTGTIHQRGASSLGYPKQSYKINLETSVGKIEARNPNLLGLREDSEWILYAPYADRDLVRSVFTTRMWKESCALQNSFGIDNGYDFRFAELFLNGSYEGLYALGYMPDEVQMNVNAAAGEVMYKSQDWVDYETDQDILDEKFSIVDAFDGFSRYANEDGWKPLEAYVSSLCQNKPLEAYWDEIDRDTFENFYLFTNVTQGYDCARGSRAKNFYVTAKWDGERLKMLYTPWDLNLTWGMYLEEYPMIVEENYYYPFGPFRRYPPEGDPAQFAELCERYRTLRSTVWSDDALFAIADELEAKIFDSGAYLRNLERWPEKDYTAGQTDLSAFKTYVLKRMIYCDQFYGGNG